MRGNSSAQLPFTATWVGCACLDYVVLIKKLGLVTFGEALFFQEVAAFGRLATFGIH